MIEDGELHLCNDLYCKEVIQEILDNIELWDGGDENREYFDNIIKLEYDDGYWGIYYSLEYGPLDKYVIFEIEKQSLFAYMCLKKYLCSEELTLVHDKGYPASEITIGYRKTKLSKQFIIEFYNLIKVIASFYYGNPEEFHWHPKFEEVQNKLESFLLELTINDYLLLNTELDYINWILNLLANGFLPVDGIFELYQVYVKGEFKVTLNEVFMSDIKYSTFINEKYVAMLQLELTDVLICTHNDKKFVVKKDGYRLINDLISKYNDSFEDETEVNFYITDDYELILYNSVFTIVQKAYISEDIVYRVLNQEIDVYEKHLKQLKNIEYFDNSNIILRFEKIINETNSTEKQIENFIQDHFKIILGKEYSKIKTQIMTKFFNGEQNDERRFDVFALNDVSNEWELFELKKSIVKVTKKIRNMPMFTSQVNDSIAQIRYYKSLIMQDSIRKQIKDKYQIKIDIPKFTLIIGKGNNADIKKCQNEINDINVVTYTQIINKAKMSNR
ncbi:hypothetical protein Psfp_01485 [Pelotomaculum sp. FP]|uniref:hypothetical protein n=1 Tax=Pelotomaculum sp. FP TaxID=261474 RepID=UPI001064750D|nr:hypothetical protein [Pelotomaculum sp. FP]TEB16258.1 hypothetical protein Psfp_01485 [Pelotomaculum sp. FP]